MQQQLPYFCLVASLLFYRLGHVCKYVCVCVCGSGSGCARTHAWRTTALKDKQPNYTSSDGNSSIVTASDHHN
jgi:hypothetical protein